MRSVASRGYLYVAFIVGAAAAAACSGDDPDDGRAGGPRGADGAGTQPTPCDVNGPTPLRRLSHLELRNTVRDLFPGYDVPVAPLVADKRVGAFDNQVAVQTVTPVLVEQYNARAFTIAGKVFEQIGKGTAKREAVLPCATPASDAEASDCGRRFVTAFGRRAFRRPLEPDELTRWTGFFEQQRKANDFDVAARLTLQAFLQAPQFLYRVEIGAASKDTNPGSEARVKLTPHELATRLSYALWGSMPDAALAKDADDGKVATREEVAAHARRMLADPRARDVVVDFHAQWLDLGRLDKATRDPDTYPEWSEDLREAARAESEQLIASSVLERDGRLSTLLLDPHAEVDGQLAKVYGVAGPASGTAPVSLDPSQRAGVLTRAAFLMGHAQTSRPSPIQRGVTVLDRLLCATPPAPPADVKLPEDADPSTVHTNRELFDLHSKSPRCAGCHKSIDPVGFGFEGYDAVGRFRSTDNGYPVNASGSFTFDGATSSFNGGVELSKRLAESKTVESCYVKQQFRYAYGRQETEADACTMQTMAAAFSAGKQDIRELLVAIVTSDAFFHRTSGGTK